MKFLELQNKVSITWCDFSLQCILQHRPKCWPIASTYMPSLQCSYNAIFCLATTTRKFLQQLQRLQGPLFRVPANFIATLNSTLLPFRPFSVHCSRNFLNRHSEIPCSRVTVTQRLGGCSRMNLISESVLMGVALKSDDLTQFGVPHFMIFSIKTHKSGKI